MEIYRSNKEKMITYGVFGIYILFLSWLVLFKFATSMDEIPNLRGINLIPFHYAQETSGHLSEVADNILVFIPAGFYLSAIFAKKNIMKVCSMVSRAGYSYLYSLMEKAAVSEYKGYKNKPI